MIKYTTEPGKYLSSVVIMQDWLSEVQSGCPVAGVKLLRSAQPQKSEQNDEHGGDARRLANT